MSRLERGWLASVLFLIMGLVSFDLLSDSFEGQINVHIFLEGLIGLASLIALFFLLKDLIFLKHRLYKANEHSKKIEQEVLQWRTAHKKHAENLNQAIQQQLNQWKLTHSEKEITFLLLKGLSIKEIAQLRKTSEKTVRAQSISIYEKSSLSGRSELSAFFLEDLMSMNSEV